MGTEHTAHGNGPEDAPHDLPVANPEAMRASEAARPAPVRARSRVARYFSWAFWLIPVFIMTTMSGVDHDGLFWSLTVVVTGALLYGYYRQARCGVDADVEGVTIKGFRRTRRLPWGDVRSIDFDDLKSQGGVATYHRLAFDTYSLEHGSNRVVASAPWGGIEPGQYLYELRERLYALRDAPLGLSVPLTDDHGSVPVRWQDQGQVVSLRRSRLEPAAVEVAVLLRARDGRYVHRRMRCIGSDLESGLRDLFNPDPGVLARAGAPSTPRWVQDQPFSSAEQAREAAHAQDPPAHPDKWVKASDFSEHYDDQLKTEVLPEAARVGMLGYLVAGVTALLLAAPLLYVCLFLPDWLGIDDPDAADTVGGIALFLAWPIPVIAWNVVAEAFRKRNLAKEMNR